jgi:hypothetical protein
LGNLEFEATNLYTHEPEKLKISLLQYVRLRLGSTIGLGERKYSNWNSSVPFYLFRCKHGRLCVDYAHSYDSLVGCRCEVLLKVGSFSFVESDDGEEEAEQQQQQNSFGVR